MTTTHTAGKNRNAAVDEELLAYLDQLDLPERIVTFCVEELAKAERPREELANVLHRAELLENQDEVQAGMKFGELRTDS